ncbi:3'-5' exoribonuclease domain-containing protein [Rhodocista pekingensis]|uniref:3'-5' exoribonuclease domain-containing protein n=1 Tax=Rhodocista pekingensis TaxID=201185 RepID=A0ABW2KTW3_9PROT
MDIYFSADIETDGPIPGPYSILSFALVYAGSYNGVSFHKPKSYDLYFYKELKPISEQYQEEALKVNGLNRQALMERGANPIDAMNEAYEWVQNLSKNGKPILVAYPLSFDWAWLYWYFIRFSKNGSPFGYSQCFDIKTAVAVKTGLPIVHAGRSRLPTSLRSERIHTHHAVDDAIEQAEVFAKVFEWRL